MKKPLNCLLSLLAIGIAGNIQAQSPQLQLWSVPPNQVNFTTGSPVSSFLPSSTATNAYYNTLSNPNQTSAASNSMHDANGNLLFFVTQDVNDYSRLKVFDKNGNVIKDANGNSELLLDYTWKDAMGVYHTDYGHVFSNCAEEISIIPVPGNCNQYYIIAGFQNEHDLLGAISYQPVYAKLDLSLSTNGVLSAASSTSNLFSLASITGITGAFQPYAPQQKYRFGIATTPFRAESSNQNYFLYVYSTYSNISAHGFYKYKVDASGISFVSVEHPTVYAAASPYANYYSEMEVVRLSSGNYRIAKTIDNSGIYWCDLDYTNGSIIPGTEKTVNLNTSYSLEGLEFSPDGNYLYYSYHGSVDKVGFLPNLSSAGTPTPTDFLTQSIGFIEVGYDGKMYFSVTPGDHLISKSVPNLPGSGSWNLSAATFTADYAGNYSDLLPDQIDGQIYYPASPTISGNNFACSTSAETYTLGGAYNPSIYYTWTITGGTPSSYTGTSSTLAVIWTTNGGTISVQSGCSTPTTFTVKPCCRYTGTIPMGISLVYLNDKTESTSVTYSGASSIIVINGVYTVNSTVTYNNCPTYFAPNAQVNINSPGYLKLLNGTVWQAGCTTMWNGIIENSGSSLLVDASTIQDAKLAIDSKAGAPFTLSNATKLNANYRNILIEAFAGTHPGVMNNSTISCLNTSGVPANCLITPYTGKRSYSGIEINNVNQVNIGLDATGQTNTFNNMDKGVINTNSGLTLYNNNFTNITYTGSGLGRCIISTNSNAPSPEKAIIVGGTTNAYQKNTFSNSTFGLFATNNQDISVTGNTFTNLGEAADMLYCTGIDNQLYFNNNIVNDCSWGLRATGNQGSKVVNAINNLVNATIVTPKPNCTAISIESSGLSGLNTPSVSINNNTITSVSTGIKVTNLTYSIVRNNQIFSLSDLGSGVPVNGILATNCPDLDAEANRITGAGSTYIDQNGMRMESCSNSHIISNSVENVGRGLFFGGTCSGTETAKNHMQNNNDGFLLNYGTTGYQLGSPSACRATENKWEGTFVNHLFSYYSDGTPSLHYLYGSPMSTTIAGGSMNPTGLVSTVYPTATAGYSVIPVGACTNLSGYKMAVDPRLMQWISIAKDETNYPVYNESAKWMAKYALYNMLKTEPELITNADLGNFASEISASNIVKLDQVNDLLVKSNSDLSAAQALVNTIVAGNLVENNLKDVFTAMIAFYQNSTLSNQQLVNLRKIAMECPYESGPGVYNARVLLSALGETTSLNACEIVPSKRQVGGLAFSKAEDNNMISVMPNPNNGLFTVSFSTEEVKDIYIYDVMGRIVFEKHNTNDRMLNIDIMNQSKGIYFVKAITSQGISLKKIINQ